MQSTIKIFLLFLILLPISSGCAARRTGDYSLWGTRGPYRGQVVDARTNLPIRGAAVVAAWYYELYAVVQTNTQFYDAVEVLTDDQGYFVVNAPEIERRAPSNTDFPVFTIFKPRYRFFKGWFADEKDMAERRNRPLLGVVKLEPNPIRGREAANENIPIYDDIPPEKIPNFVKAVKEYRSQIGR